jgi:Domain of unknown function (DUF4149)
MLGKLKLIVITFWVGGLWMTGLSASVLFDVIEGRQLAGNVAGQLFTTISTIGLVGGSYLLIQSFFEHKTASFKQRYVWVLILMLVLILVGQYGVQPYLAQIKVDALPLDVMSSDHAGRFAAWHGVAGGVYLIECLLGVALVLTSQS